MDQCFRCCDSNSFKYHKDGHFVLWSKYSDQNCTGDLVNETKYKWWPDVDDDGEPLEDADLPCEEISTGSVQIKVREAAVTEDDAVRVTPYYLAVLVVFLDFVQ